MKLLYDFFPLIIFFIVYKTVNILWATGVLIIASAIQVLWMWYKFKKVEPMYIITFVLVFLFGGATIIFHDAMFLKWKVSIVNWLFVAAFLLTQVFGKKPLIAYLMDKQVQLPKLVWQRLNLMWALFFLLMGTVNIYVAYAFSTDIWVDFKVFGMLGLTIIFVVIQTAYLYKHIKHMHE